MTTGMDAYVIVHLVLIGKFLYLSLIYLLIQATIQVANDTTNIRGILEKSVSCHSRYNLSISNIESTQVITDDSIEISNALHTLA